MITNRTFISIYTFWSSESLFEQPIMVDGIVMNEPIIRNENDLWDLTGIFDKPDVTPTGKIMDLSDFFPGHV